MLVVCNKLLGLQKMLIKLRADLAEFLPSLFMTYPFFVQHFLEKFDFIIIFLVISFEFLDFLGVKLWHFSHE